MADTPWRQIGFTYYNDPPPGAGNLAWGGYSFAELGTASRAGQLTGRGNLAQAMGLTGEEPMGSEWTLHYGGKTVYARKEDRGYGQGGDGTYSDPRYAIDLYDGAAYHLPNLLGALGAPPSGALWIMRGRWHAPMALPPGAAQLQPLGGLVAGPATGLAQSKAQYDYSQKVTKSGKGSGEHGSSLQRINTALSGLPGRYRR